MAAIATAKIWQCLVLQDKLASQKQKSVLIRTHKLIYDELVEAPLFDGAFFIGESITARMRMRDLAAKWSRLMGYR